MDPEMKAITSFETSVGIYPVDIAYTQQWLEYLGLYILDFWTDNAYI